MRRALREEQDARALEAQLDSLLLAELDESKVIESPRPSRSRLMCCDSVQISVLPHGMDDSYLQVLMAKLTDLYLESNEIKFKQLKLI